MYKFTAVLSSGHPDNKVVWGRRRLQCDGDGATGAQSGGSVQLLFPKVQPQDSSAAGRPDGERVKEKLLMDICFSKRLWELSIHQDFDVTSV